MVSQGINENMAACGLAEQEDQLVREVLRLYHLESNQELVTAKVRELRAVRRQLQELRSRLAEKAQDRSVHLPVSSPR